MLIVSTHCTIFLHSRFFYHVQGFSPKKWWKVKSISNSLYLVKKNYCDEIFRRFLTKVENNNSRDQDDSIKRSSSQYMLKSLDSCMYLLNMSIICEKVVCRYLLTFLWLKHGLVIRTGLNVIELIQYLLLLFQLCTFVLTLKNYNMYMEFPSLNSTCSSKHVFLQRLVIWASYFKVNSVMNLANLTVSLVKFNK